MWHQVKSFGETNMAIAFHFKQFQGRKHLNTSDCPKNISPVKLSDVDADLKYPGHGLMTMGNADISEIQNEHLPELINRKKGHITKRNTYRVVYRGHSSGDKNMKLIKHKAKNLYNYLSELADGKAESVTHEFIQSISREQVRPVHQWLFPIEPENSCDNEYSVFEPEEITRIIEEIKERNNGKIGKKIFVDGYQKLGGTLKFAEEFWTRLAGDKLEIKDTSKTIEYALENYELHRGNDPEAFNVGDDGTIITPQGHKSQPKRNVGGYSSKDEDAKNEEDNKVEGGENQEDEELEGDEPEGEGPEGEDPEGEIPEGEGPDEEIDEKEDVLESNVPKNKDEL